MPKYSLLEARSIANQLLDRGVIAEMNQVSHHRFEVSAEYLVEPIRTREKFTFNQGWITARSNRRVWWFAIPAIVLTAVTASFFANNYSGNSVSQMTSNPEVTNWVQDDDFDPESLSVLVATGRLEIKSNSLIEVKRIELGGYLSLLLNDSLADETRLIRVDLVKSDSSWKIEKWVQLD